MFNKFIKLEDYCSSSINSSSRSSNNPNQSISEFSGCFPRVSVGLRQEKYKSTKAFLFRRRLDFIVEGKAKEAPTELSNQDLEEFSKIVDFNPFSSSNGSPFADSSSQQQLQSLSSANYGQRRTDGKPGVTWQSDSVRRCTICSRSFTVFFRRHHCRKCGSVVCGLCAPSKNSKPILELGYSHSVRHCRKCYLSPLVRWT